MSTKLILTDRDAYHQQFDKISNTMLRTFIDDPWLFYLRYIDRSKTFTPTKAMEFGSIVHAVALEQRPLRSVVGIYPKQLLSKVGAITRSCKEFASQNPDYRYWVKPAQFETLKMCINDLRCNEFYTELIDRDDMIRELPLYFEHDKTGMQCRCMPDFYRVDGARAFVFDLKVTSDSLDFGKKINQFRYWTQACHYSEGVIYNHPDVETVEYYFLAHSPEEPFHSTMWQIDGNCQAAYDHWMRKLAEAIAMEDFRHDAEKQINKHSVSAWSLGVNERRER